MMRSAKNKKKLKDEIMPQQYIDGETVFLGNRILVTEDVFIPRPETELLVQKAVDLLSEMPSPSPRILELCTGSGAVAVALATSNPASEITSTDISSEAIEVARRNIERHQLLERVTFLRSDIYNDLPERLKNKYDLIVANPPYVSETGYKYFTDDWVRSEPPEAFLAGEHGLDVIEPIINGAKGFLRAKGAVVLEVGYDQAVKVKRIFKDNGYVNVSSLYDHNGFERIIWGTLNG